MIKYSKALLLYADRMVEPQYASLFELCCDYSRLEAMLEGEEIPDFTYRKKDGRQLRLRILKFYHYDSAGKETLWIFLILKSIILNHDGFIKMVL